MKPFPRAAAGFTYITVLAVAAVIGISAQTAVSLGSTDTQREREAELLFRGKAYQEAIRSFYHAASPKRFPRSLDELLKDPRFLHKRHLRRLYSEPMGTEWRIIMDDRGGIVGVASGSERTPFKQAEFPEGLEHFSGAKSYGEWLFIYEPGKAIPKTRLIVQLDERGSRAGDLRIRID